MQPLPPQAHPGPEGSMVMCPTSPAKPSSPDQSLPSRTIPPPNPVPRVIITIEFEPLPAPARYSPRAAQEASFSIKTGVSVPILSERSEVNGKSFVLAMFGAWTSIPFLRSTVPGIPIPIADISSPANPFMKPARFSMSGEMPIWASERVFFSPSMSPFSEMIFPLRLVPPMSMPRNFRFIFPFLNREKPQAAATGPPRNFYFTLSFRKNIDRGCA